MATVQSSFSAPTVNAQALQRQLSPTILVNVVQSLFHTNGKGINQEVVVDTDVYEVRVIREKPLTQSVRRVGAATDGGFFSSQTAEQPTSDSYGIRLDFVYDTPIDIPVNMANMIRVNLANATMRNYNQAVAKNINAHTIAAQLVAGLEYSVTNTEHLVSYIHATDSILDIFQDANAVLDDGDAVNGVDTYNASSRIALWRSTSKRAFFKTAKSVLDIGNWKAQEMLRVGAVDPESFMNTDKNGFFGEIDQVYNFMVAAPVFTLAEKFILDDGTQTAAGTLDAVDGYICASMGTLRGIAINSTMKIVDSQAGAGIRMQPAQRWGVEVIYPSSIVTIFASTGTNPAIASVLTIEAPAVSL
jgi:hypothetical protein